MYLYYITIINIIINTIFIDYINVIELIVILLMFTSYTKLMLMSTYQILKENYTSTVNSVKMTYFMKS
jgi:hypothetical protein